MVLPFPIKLPTEGNIELAENIPDFNGADGVAADEGECREEVETDDLEPELGDRMLEVRLFSNFLRFQGRGNLPCE